MKTELECVVEVRAGAVWIRLAGAFRASSAADLADLLDARGGADAPRSVVADLSALEVCDSCGVDALQSALARFASASIVAPSRWTQARTIVLGALGNVRSVERATDVPVGVGPERRKHARLLPRTVATLAVDGARALEATIEDVSYGGARLSRIRGDHALDDRELEALVGRRIRVEVPELRLADRAARIMHVRREPSGLGIAFDEPLNGAVSRLATFQG